MPVAPVRVKPIKRMSRTRPVGRKATTTTKRGGKVRGMPLTRARRTSPTTPISRFSR